ncbi:winged helix-turn-helix domain-containing protein [Streptomyces sp. TRM70350]|uniref:winged helix-turn-helix domain-containing protein n=1 Tax=Streptomyces sp. TRM70350 TaxID=2856165 RepID=UPI001C45DF02|nr:winged helix-turn-helix domain-containing protein [Streptomyces sp. TRM70350]MBV7701052.1 winged helix-turn-helix domain-containing protein [Streptomyces sp. TRM70350]
MIGRRFHLTYTIQGVRKPLVRNGWSCQVPARPALERDDDAVAGWLQGGGALRGRLAAACGAWLVFEDEAGFSLTSPQAKTWSQRGRTRHRVPRHVWP